MALTDKKRRFVAALQSGLKGAKAAEHAGYSKATAAQAASRLMKDPDVLAELARKETVNKAKEQAKDAGRPVSMPDLARMFSDPKAFLMALMNDAGEDIKLRADAAKALMPYEHERKADAGKKKGKEDAAKTLTGGRFAPTPPPPRSRAN